MLPTDRYSNYNFMASILPASGHLRLLFSLLERLFPQISLRVSPLPPFNLYSNVTFLGDVFSFHLI